MEEKVMTEDDGDEDSAPILKNGNQRAYITQNNNFS